MDKILVIVIAVLIVFGIVWFHISYRCAQSHYETVTVCSTTEHGSTINPKFVQRCHERQEEVCDDWEKR